MFNHAAFKPLWPVILFLPWFLLGFAYLLESLLHRRPGGALIYRVQGVHRQGVRGEKPTEVRSSAPEVPSSAREEKSS